MTTNFKVKRVNLSLQIADHLEEYILSPEVKIDKKLPSELQLAADFQVSRPIIREALKLLEERGLIAQRNGSGAYVTKPDQQSLYKSLNRIVAMDKLKYNEIHETRLIMEVSTIHLAAQNMTEEQLNDLNEIYKMERDFDIDMHTRVSLDAKFHNKIAEGCGNSLLQKFIESLIALSEEYMKTGGLSESGKEDAIAEHALILSNLKKRDSEGAAQAMKKHLFQAQTNVNKYNETHESSSDSHTLTANEQREKKNS